MLSGLLSNFKTCAGMNGRHDHVVIKQSGKIYKFKKIVSTNTTTPSV